MEDASPRQRLAAFVAANLNAADHRRAGVFALGNLHRPAPARIRAWLRAHREGYLGFRNEVEAVVAELLGAEASARPDANQLRHHAIAINAIIDGLWVEGCLAGEMFWRLARYRRRFASKAHRGRAPPSRRKRRADNDDHRRSPHHACSKRHGVDTVFGIPGVHTVELYRGLARSKIRHVTPRHEQGAGFMADGYARASGRPGVAFVITGPGLTNTITAMGQARADSVPMLVISGVNAHADAGQGPGLSARTARPARHDGEGGAVFAAGHRGRRIARRFGAGLRAVFVVAARPGAYRDPDRRHGQAGRRHRCRADQCGAAGAGWRGHCRGGQADAQPRAGR